MLPWSVIRGAYRLMEILMDDVNNRVWRNFDLINDKLIVIESQIKDVVRIDEKINQHDATLLRSISRLDSHDEKINNIEISQASSKTAAIRKTLSSVEEQIDLIDGKVDKLESEVTIFKSAVDMAKNIIKWASGIVAAMMIFWLTKRFK